MERCEADVERKIVPAWQQAQLDAGWRPRLGSRRAYEREHVRCPRPATGTRKLYNHHGSEPYMAGPQGVEGRVCGVHMRASLPYHWKVYA